MNSKKRVCIVGAGVTGLTACKHVLEKGFSPTVLESGPSIGGIWARTFACTRLQTTRTTYQFSDLPWKPEIDLYPDHDEVMEYLDSYSKKFDLYKHIRFGCEVVGVEYVGVDEDEIMKWDEWSGNGEAFGTGKGVWLVSVKSEVDGVIEVHETDFLILCIGRFSGFPNIPDFPVNSGPEVFNGKVIHSSDYANMGGDNARQLVKGKRVTVVGYMKSGLDIAAECANANGVEYPCTIICRTKRWIIPGYTAWGIPLDYFYYNRFSEFVFHKHATGFLLWLLATLLSPLAWLATKFIESYFKWTTPMKKYGMLPDYNFSYAYYTCMVAKLPDKFYDRVEQGSIIIQKSKKFSFCKNGVIVDGQTSPVESDLVILATGFKGDKKLTYMFTSPYFQEIVAGTSTTCVRLYRECINPKIPQLAIIGYPGSHSNVYTSELRSKWVAHFLDGAFRLPSIKTMEENLVEWVKHENISNKSYRRACIGTDNIWYNDLLCRDMGLNPKRKKGLLKDLFLPYGPNDYVGI